MIYSITALFYPVKSRIENVLKQKCPSSCEVKLLLQYHKGLRCCRCFKLKQMALSSIHNIHIILGLIKMPDHDTNEVFTQAKQWPSKTALSGTSLYKSLWIKRVLPEKYMLHTTKQPLGFVKGNTVVLIRQISHSEN